MRGQTTQENHKLFHITFKFPNLEKDSWLHSSRNRPKEKSGETDSGAGNGSWFGQGVRLLCPSTGARRPLDSFEVH